jgi:hypothetical protein
LMLDILFGPLRSDFLGVAPYAIACANALEETAMKPLLDITLSTLP